MMSFAFAKSGQKENIVVCGVVDYFTGHYCSSVMRVDTAPLSENRNGLGTAAVAVVGLELWDYFKKKKF